MAEESVRIPAYKTETGTGRAGCLPGPQKCVKETTRPHLRVAPGRAPARGALGETCRSAGPAGSGGATRSSGGRRRSG
eukprot:1308616-Pyramimonas_sp.AAC.1